MTTTAHAPDMIETAKGLRAEIESYSEEGQQLRRLPDGLARAFKRHAYSAWRARSSTAASAPT